MTRRRLPDLRDERGFTVIELISACALGIVILLAIGAMIDTTLTVSRADEARVNSMQRSRLGLEDIVTRLRSQVCLGPGNPPVLAGSATSVTFYANLGTVDANPDKRRITLANGLVTEETYTGTGTPPLLTFPATPTTTRPILARVEAVPGQAFLSYYAYDSVGSPTPDELLATPLSITDAARVVRIAITFRTQPDQSFAPGPTSVILQDSVIVRIATPTDPRSGAQCG